MRFDVVSSSGLDLDELSGVGEELDLKKSKQALPFLFQEIYEYMLESLRMKEGGIVDDFMTKLSTLASKESSHWYELEEVDLVKREVGRLKANEERIKGTDKIEDIGLLLASQEKSHGCKHCGNGNSNQGGFGRG
ncbi:hypothetical protein Tco_1302166 [Tanacetum coccineum]